jgi:N-acetylglucosamine-6-phosphate deacetylase
MGIVGPVDIIVPHEVIPYGYMEIQDGHIVAIGDAEQCLQHDGTEKDSGSGICNLSSGWLDLQVNGAGDVLFEDIRSLEELQHVGNALLAEGTTRWFGALISPAAENLERIVRLVRSFIGQHGLTGIHLEGPWISSSYRGCHPQSRIASSSTAHVKFVEDLSTVCPVIVSLAPEVICREDAIALSNLKNVSIFAAHSNMEELGDFPGNITAITHIMNGMPPIGSRSPGAAGWLVSDGRRRASIICDGAHVHRDTVSMLKRASRREQLFLVSDLMPEVAVAQGRVPFLDNPHVIDGTIRTQNGKLAGSTRSIRAGIKFLVQAVGVPLLEAVRMATIYPSDTIGLPYGGLRVGALGDYVMFDNQLNVVGSWRSPCGI